MTINRISRLRNKVRGVTIEGVRKNHLVPIADKVSSFEQLGAPAAIGDWIAADAHPALFDRDAESLQQDLTELWQKHGRHPLLPLAAPVSLLAEQARQEPLRNERKISSTVYAM